jgi:type 1 fimbria pilin
MPTCNVDAGSVNTVVTLPTIGTSSLTGTNSTSSATPFGITLNCQAGANVSITMTSTRQWSTNGVIRPTTGGGYASNVGVQLLDGNQNPIQWNAAQTIGSVSNGPITIPYYAQYYQTAATVGAGKVTGQATFTVNYQ